MRERKRNDGSPAGRHHRRQRQGGLGAGLPRPAVQGLAGLALGAVVTRDLAGAEAAAEAFGPRVGYVDPQALVDDPEIDVVTVAVKAPDHHDLVFAALRTGKSLYCEWPLSPTSPA